MSNEIKYPNIAVDLIGKDGNAFAILGAVKNALRKNNVPQAEISKFFADATTGDYNHLLQTVMQWVSIKEIVCPDCLGDGFLEDLEGNEIECQGCNGAGYIE